METLTNDMKLGQGNNSVVYRISENRVVKVLRFHGKRKDLAHAMLSSEYLASDIIHGVGISSPEFFGVREFKTEGGEHYYDNLGWEVRPGIVMSFVEGTRFDMLGEELMKGDNLDDIERYNKLSLTIDAELEKARAKGFTPYDVRFGKNTIVTPSDDVVLIDLWGWRHKDHRFYWDNCIPSFEG